MKLIKSEIIVGEIGHQGQGLCRRQLDAQISRFLLSPLGEGRREGGTGLVITELNYTNEWTDSLAKERRETRYRYMGV